MLGNAALSLSCTLEARIENILPLSRVLCADQICDLIRTVKVLITRVGSLRARAEKIAAWYNAIANRSRPNCYQPADFSMQ